MTELEAKNNVQVAEPESNNLENYSNNDGNNDNFNNENQNNSKHVSDMIQLINFDMSYKYLDKNLHKININISISKDYLKI